MLCEVWHVRASGSHVVIEDILTQSAKRNMHAAHVYDKTRRPPVARHLRRTIATVMARLMSRKPPLSFQRVASAMRYKRHAARAQCRAMPS